MNYPDECPVFENNNGHILEGVSVGVNVLWGRGCVWARYVEARWSYGDDWAYDPNDLTPLTPAAHDMIAIARAAR